MRVKDHSPSGCEKPGLSRVGTAIPGPMRLLALCLGLVVIVSATRAGAADEYARIREKAGEMLVAVNKAMARPPTEGKTSELEKAYSGYAYLLTPGKLEALAKLIDESSDDAAKAKRAKTAAVISYSAVRYKVARVVDDYRNARRDQAVGVEGGGDIVLLGLDHRIGLQENRDMRRKWWLAASQLYTGMKVYQRSLLMDLNAEAKHLGYSGYYPFLQEVEGWDIDIIRTSAESLLADTQEAYKAQLEEWYQREFDLELRKMRTYDAARLFFFPDLSVHVEKAKPLDVATATLKDLGLKLKKQQTLKVYVRDKKKREPVAGAYPIDTGKTLVTMIPSGNVTDFQDLLGALGEAEFHYLMPSKTAFEVAYIGNNILPSAYRALFEMIVEEPAWISSHLKLNEAAAEDMAKAFRFRRLYKMREAAGKFLFQLQLHEDPQIDPAVYNDVMEKALLWKRTRNDEDAYLTSNDDYRSGGLLLGYVVAAQIRDALRAQWGPEWFRKPELAKKLTSGSERGYAITLDEFLGLWGIAALDPGTLASQLVEK